MSDYIEREAVLSHYKKCSFAMVKAVIAYIEDVPAADVAPVRHGTWEISPTYGFLMCSECHDCCYIMGGKKWNFCPNCGAKLDGGDDDAANHV